MKLDIKKIALILAASIFAFSGVFGQDEERGAAVGVGRAKERATAVGGEKERAIRKIKIENLEAETVDLDVNEGAVSGIKGLTKGEKEISIPEDLDSIDFKIRQKGKQAVRNIKIKLKRCQAKYGEDCKTQIIQQIKNRLEEKGIDVNVDKDKDGIKITIKHVKDEPKA